MRATVPNIGTVFGADMVDYAWGLVILLPFFGLNSQIADHYSTFCNEFLLQFQRNLSILVQQLGKLITFIGLFTTKHKGMYA
jgi:hypothetical protein